MVAQNIGDHYRENIRTKYNILAKKKVANHKEEARLTSAISISINQNLFKRTKRRKAFKHGAIYLERKETLANPLSRSDGKTSKAQLN